MEDNTIKIEGTVENVLFRNESNGYIVLEIDSKGELITVVGTLGDIDDGEHLSLVGKYVTHSKFGVQFQAEYCDRKLPNTAINIQKYLSSGAIKGIGPSFAKKIVDEFGERTLEIMENEPMKLMQIKGITPKKCDSIAAEVKKIFNLRILMTYLAGYGIKAQYAMKAFQKWDLNSMEMIKNNPYILCEYGIDLEFKKAERIAKDLRISACSPKRIRAGIVDILMQNVNVGHTCLPLDRLQPVACKHLEISEQDFYNTYNEALEEEIYEYRKNEREFVYLSDYYFAESYIAGRLSVLEAFSQKNIDDYDNLIEIEEQENNIKYEKLQREAISASLSKGLVVLTGGPGTGKTTTLNAIISLYQKQGNIVMIAAPTGRAAKRVSDLTGYDAKTIHRLLEVEFDKSGKLKFKHNENNPLNCDVLVIDEMSMVDVLLFESVLRALKLSCKIIMVGDSDQLPPVGAGNILKDLISSQQLTVIKLKEIFRQAQESCIVTNAHKIVNGINPDLKQKQSDFFFFQRLENESVLEMVIDLCKKRLPKAYGYSPLDDIQILCPSRKGPLGVVEVNKAIQGALNPKKAQKREVRSFIYTFREGDKVMQTRNNYDITWRKDGEDGAGIFNGDIGKILSINKQKLEVMIDFDGRITSYDLDLLEQLELAYAITVHKSQGSEFEAVIMPILGGFEKLYYRNLLYTAVTRAKKLMILIGSQVKINQMVENNRKTLRYSCLKAMLTNEIGKDIN
ncbi:MAG: ATP-dependent RecD-like DNA helicase [Clostridiales bacterium]|nr:ATP-dependent RecD-like DNA helicase [Clostridiales bacterium]